MPVRKEVNKSFFKEWTPEMAYVLGFFLADGSLDVNARGGEYFNFHICDRELLDAIREVLGSTHKISTRKRQGNQNNLYRLQIGSKEMCNDLRKLGVKEQKVHFLSMPPVPNKFLHHFIRGYFDGDGNIWMGRIHSNRAKSTTALHLGFTSCSKKFLEDLKSILQSGGLKGGSLFGRDNTYKLQYSINDSIMLYWLMYSDECSVLYLPRKRSVFEKFLKMRP